MFFSTRLILSSAPSSFPCGVLGHSFASGFQLLTFPSALTATFPIRDLVICFFFSSPLHLFFFPHSFLFSAHIFHLAFYLFKRGKHSRFINAARMSPDLES